ncbi:MFS transporter [Alsobacter sp. SYSU M60028]|uniref:MFS transporter n=1 Tax=Alsobacter ponti TaxID=2962936 RepID=A0ABT1L9N2_9HYPH|nr:MFS transporter [Alsobacter ponti]
MTASTDRAATAAPSARAGETTVFRVLLAISLSHFLNDVMQSLIPAIYPILKDDFRLDFGQIGIITLAFQLTASMLQPLVGIATDRRPMPYSLPVGMSFTLVGLLLLSWASSFGWLIVAVALVGAGSAVFHPEASRVARLASGGRHGLAQSLFQVGGNAGTAAGPLLAAFIVLPGGQRGIAWFSLVALAGICVLAFVGSWYAAHRRAVAAGARKPVEATRPNLTRGEITRTLVILVTLLFSKFFYMACLGTYYTFYLIETFDVSVRNAQLLLFVFLGSVAVGVLVGGPIGDRFGRRFVIWFSILGVLPFTLALPYVGLAATVALTVVIGLVLASASSAILVYAQEMLPGRVGLVSGVFFGFAFGLGGLGAAVLGELADMTSLTFVFRLCAFLPALGLLAVFIPDLSAARNRVVSG